MTGVSQFESHPDQELLAAFAEQALAGAEHAAVVAHVAACSRCRQIVFLASDAANQEAAFVPVAEALAQEPETEEELALETISWLTTLRRAWMPLSALAFAILLTVAVHHLRSIAATEAQLQPLTTPPASQPHTVSASSEAVPPVPVERASVAPRPVAASTQKKPEPTAPPPPMPANKSMENLDQVAIPAELAQVAPPDLAQRAPASAAENAPEVRGSVRSAGISNMEAAVRAERSRVIKATSSDPHGEFNNAPQLAAVQAPAQVHIMAAKAVVRLPSGAAPASLAHGAERTLALDAAGSLYLSLDHGLTWKQVSPQWSGHAIRVTLQGEPSSLRADTNRIEVNKMKAAEIFEVTNDQGQTWDSTDGLSWHKR